MSAKSAKSARNQTLNSADVEYTNKSYGPLVNRHAPARVKSLFV